MTKICLRITPVDLNLFSSVKLSRSIRSEDDTFPNNFRDFAEKVRPWFYNNADVSLTTYESRSSNFDLTASIFNGESQVGSCSMTFEEAKNKGLTQESEWGVAGIFTVIVLEDDTNNCKLNVLR